MSDKDDKSDDQYVIHDDHLLMEDKRDYALVEILLRLSSLENLLINTGVIKREDLTSYLREASDLLVDSLKDTLEKGALDNVFKKSDNNGMKN